jgi:hypothetical protein
MMAYFNGRLPNSVLGTIYHGRLRKDAARAWNAMNMESQGAYGLKLAPTGSMSSYRTLAEQVYLWNNVEHAHDTNWVALPGTSNHGLGLAVDLASTDMRTVVDTIGERYGWAKRWSDAPAEWWHLRWKSGVWDGQAPYGYYVVNRGNSGASVLKLKQMMWKRGVRQFNHVSPYFGVKDEAALQRFQGKHSLTADGIAGPKTWFALQH